MWDEQIQRNCGSGSQVVTMWCGVKGAKRMAFVWHSFLWRAGEDKVRAEWDGATEGSLFLVYIKQGKLDFQILKWLWLPLQHLLFAVFKILLLVIIFLGTVYFVQASNESSAAWTPSIFEFRVNKPRPHVRSHSLIGLQ